MSQQTPPDYASLSLEMHERNQGKLEITSKVSIKNVEDLSIAYSPGVAAPCKEIQKHPQRMRDLVMNGKTIAVISDGSAVLGLGDIGPKASLPVMEGKAALFKQFAGLNAFPLALDTTDPEAFITTVKHLSVSFGGINLEDISAPRCFTIEERLKKELDIPVFHDDQHGTAIVVLAGLINALQVTERNENDVRIVINGAGASGVATCKILHAYGFKDITVCDSKGIISEARDDLNSVKEELISYTNPRKVSGGLEDALTEADVFIGLSKADILTPELLAKMQKDPIIFALANPDPEIKPSLAHEQGVRVMATGRSDHPNQINNVLVFPGIFKGALDADTRDITESMKLAAAKALAELVASPNPDKIVPHPFDESVVDVVAKAVYDEAKEQ